MLQVEHLTAVGPTGAFMSLAVSALQEASCSCEESGTGFVPCPQGTEESVRSQGGGGKHCFLSLCELLFTDFFFYQSTCWLPRSLAHCLVTCVGWGFSPEPWRVSILFYN